MMVNVEMLVIWKGNHCFNIFVLNVLINHNNIFL